MTAVENMADLSARRKRNKRLGQVVTWLLVVAAVCWVVQLVDHGGLWSVATGCVVAIAVAVEAVRRFTVAKNDNGRYHTIAFIVTTLAFSAIWIVVGLHEPVALRNAFWAVVGLGYVAMAAIGTKDAIRRDTFMGMLRRILDGVEPIGYAMVGTAIGIGFLASISELRWCGLLAGAGILLIIGSRWSHHAGYIPTAKRRNARLMLMWACLMTVTIVVTSFAFGYQIVGVILGATWLAAANTVWFLHRRRS